jgi:MFS family permease
MERGPVSLSAYWRLVRENDNFRRLWFAQIISEIGDWLYTVAIYSLLLDLTQSARSVALAVVLQVLPQFFVAPTAGVINDRVSRKQVMIATDLVRAGIVLAMLFVSRAQIVWLIYLLLMLETMMWAFFEPGRSSVVPNITDHKDLVVANGLSSMTWSFNLAVGSALGGAVAAFFGRDTVFIVNCLSFLVSAAFVRSMHFREPHLADARPLCARDLVDFSPIAEGIHYVVRDRRLLATLLVKAGLGFLGTHWVLLPIFGERIFPVQAAGLDPQRSGMLGMSLLMGSRGVGALIGPLIGGYWAGSRHARLRRGILYGFLAGSLGYFGLSVAPSLWTACAAVVLAHAGGSVIWVFSTTLLQFQTEDRFRGRVFSADYASLVVTMSAASYAAGTLVDQGVPVRDMALFTGIFSLLPAGIWLFGLRLWREPRTRAAEAATPEPPSRA